MNASRKEYLQSLAYNGYQWTGFTSGLHYFQKEHFKNGVKGWSTICCTESQLTNGDLLFMCLHNYTLSVERQAEAKKIYLSTFTPLFNHEQRN